MDNRNLILAIVLSVAILFGFEMFFPSTPSAPTGQAQVQPQPQPQGQAQPLSATPTAPGGATPVAPGGAPVGTPQFDEMAQEKNLQELIDTSTRVSITSPSLTGSISLTGGRIDDLVLNGYNETLDENSPKIRLLNPRGALDAYYAEFGWVGTNAKLPGADSVWTADKSVLSPESPVTLTWNNGEGLTFTRVIALDKDFMFTVTQRVTNSAASTVTLNS